MSLNSERRVMLDVETERAWQTSHYDMRSDTHLERLAIVAEEFGEVAKCVALLDVAPVTSERVTRQHIERTLYHELVDLGASILGWAALIDACADATGTLDALRYNQQAGEARR
jgi:hypothetical protein